MTDRALASLLLTLLVVAPSLGAQQVTPPGEEPESPEFLFDQKIGDVGVVVDAQGTWNTRLATGWGSGFTDSPASTLPGLGYPGFERGPVFTQVPDFSLELRLLDRYYFQMDYRGTLDDRAFLVGYDGQPSEAVQWVKVGNVPFGVPTRAGQSLAEGRRGAPAGGAAFAWGPVDLEALARYEDGSRETRTFRGFLDSSSARVPLDAWITGRFFRLPGTGPFSGIRVLVADPEGPFGSGTRRYRAATPAEVSVDTSTGELSLPAPATRRYLVTWTGAPGSHTQALTGIGSPQESVSGAGTFFVLVQPGTPSAFELRNRYPVPKGTSGAIVLVDPATESSVAGHPVSQSPTQDWFEAGGPEEAPFFDNLSGSLRGLYPVTGPGTPPVVTVTLPWEFRLPTTSPQGQGYALGSDVDPTSLVVVRNGMATTAFHFDISTGTLTLDVPVFDTDTVQISYQRTSAATKATDLALWQGGRWAIGPDQSLEWNLQGRWNLNQGQYTTEDLQSPGRVSATALWKGTAGDWDWSVSATGGALLSDSTGHRRLYGQATGGTQATLDGNSLRPSAPPGIGPWGPNLDVLNRAPTFYRNYWSNDPLTGVPSPAAWDKSGVAREPWEADGWMGPFLVRGDGQRADRLAVVEADLGPNQWSGLQVFLDSGRPLDLRSATAVTLNLRIPEGLNGATVYLQAGTLAEDFDGTGTVRVPTYRSVPALGFSDQGTRRFFPIPEDSTWGNDAAKDGSAGEDGDLVTVALATLDNTQTGWQSVRVVLTDAQRQALVRTTGWRLVLVGTGSTLGTRTLLAGPVAFEGASWSVVGDPAASGTVNPAEQDDPSRTNARLLRVDWSGRAAWSVQGRNAPVRPASYRTIAFLVRYPSLVNDSTFTVALTDPEGRGLRASWPVQGSLTQSTVWTKVRIDLQTLVLTLDGVKAGTVTLDRATAPWDRMTVAKAGSADSGTLLVSEVEAVDPIWEPLGTSRVAAGWRQGAPWPSAEVPLVSGASVSVESLQEGLTADSAAWNGRAAFGGTLGPLRANGEASFTRTSRTSAFHGAYEATLPLSWPGGGPTLEWRDRFSDRGLRDERMTLGLPWVGTWEAGARAEGSSVGLDQDYRLGWTSPSQWPGGFSMNLNSAWDQSWPRGPHLDSFGPQWVDSWGWLRPAEGTAPYHLVQSSGSMTLPLGSEWSLVTRAQAQAAQTVGTLVKWSPSGSWELRVPYRPAEAGWTLTPTVGKRVESAFAVATPLAPWESAREGARWLGSQPGGLVGLPFAEQFGGSPWDQAGIQTGLLDSTLGAEWTRDAGSDWTELVLPLAGGANFRAAQGRQASADYDLQSVSTHLQARALNLFGQLGSVPLLSWYRTDVFTWSTTGTWSTGTRETDRTADLSAALRTDLVLTQAESLGLPLTYSGRWGSGSLQSVGIRPQWTLSTDADLPFDLPRWLSPKAFKRLWVQDLSAALAFGWEPTPSPVLRDLLVTWKGRLVLSDKSELALTTRWGQLWQNHLTMVSLDAALDFLLSF